MGYKLKSTLLAAVLSNAVPFAPAHAIQEQVVRTPTETAENSPAQPNTGSSELFSALAAVLDQLIEQRKDIEALPSEDDYWVGSMWEETREERSSAVDELLAEALDIVLSVSVKDIQSEIHETKERLSAIDSELITLREERLTTSSDSLESVEKRVASLENERLEQKTAHDAATDRLRKAIESSGVSIAPEQIKLLSRSVLADDVVKLVAVYNAVQSIEHDLGRLLSESQSNGAAARRYYAIHASLLALLAHAQSLTVENIDHIYLPRLQAIVSNTENARRESEVLLSEIEDDHRRRLLTSNVEAQEITLKVASAYLGYLQLQRSHFAGLLSRTVQDLRIADNTLQTVDTSVEMLALMQESAAFLAAIQGLEAPDFDQIFDNAELLREFESLTDKLQIPSS